MDLKILNIITPYITLALAIGVGMIGWFVRCLIAETATHFADLKSDLGRRIDKVETDLKRLESARAMDQKYLFENYISSQVFYLSVGETKSLIGKIFDEMKEVNRLIHQAQCDLQTLQERTDERYEGR